MNQGAFILGDLCFHMKVDWIVWNGGLGKRFKGRDVHWGEPCGIRAEVGSRGSRDEKSAASTPALCWVGLRWPGLYCCCAQSCLILCDPVDCNSPGSSVRGFFPARIWSRLPFPSPGDLPGAEIEPVSPALTGRFFTAGVQPQQDPGVPSGWTASVSERERDQTGVCSRVWQRFIFHRSFYTLS